MTLLQERFGMFLAGDELFNLTLLITLIRILWFRNQRRHYFEFENFQYLEWIRYQNVMYDQTIFFQSNVISPSQREEGL